jgi:hypothetical protein
VHALGRSPGRQRCFLLHRGPNAVSHSRGLIRPSFARNSLPSKTEGAGKTGCALHPRSRVRFAQKQSAHEHTGSAESIRPSLRNGFTAYIVISPADRACCHRRSSEALASLELDASIGASGPHDFTVRVSALVSSTSASTASPSQRSRRWPTPLLAERDNQGCARDLGSMKTEIFLHRALDMISENQKLICPSG